MIGGISQQVASAATTAVPGLAPWVAQAVLLQQQHQQQLAATAAAAQAAFLAQGAMLAELTALDPALAPYGALVGGGAQHSQLQAALAALGLEGGGDAGQGAAFQGGLGAGDGGGDWQAGNPALIGLQARWERCGTLCFLMVVTKRCCSWSTGCPLLLSLTARRPVPALPCRTTSAAMAPPATAVAA